MIRECGPGGSVPDYEKAKVDAEVTVSSVRLRALVGFSPEPRKTESKNGLFGCVDSPSRFFAHLFTSLFNLEKARGHSLSLLDEVLAAQQAILPQLRQERAVYDILFHVFFDSD